MGQKSSLLEVILEIRPPATRVEHYFEQIFQTLFWADVWNITFSHHSHFNWCWKWIVRILAKYELSGVCLWCVGKCPTADCSHCPTLGWAMFLKQQQHVAQCFEHPLYIGHICTGHVPICPMSSVQCPMYIANIVLHCKQCPTLQAMSYIANFVLHCRHCPTLKSQCPEKPYNYLWSASPPAANTSWRGSHSLPAKPLSDIFETFWISSSSQYVWEMFKIPQKCLTRIIQHVTRFSWLWASIYSETALF